MPRIGGRRISTCVGWPHVHADHRQRRTRLQQLQPSWCAARDIAINVNRKVAPPPELEVAQSRPPCDSTMERLIDKPIPVPSVLVVKNGLKIRSSCSGGNPI